MKDKDERLKWQSRTSEFIQINGKKHRQVLWSETVTQLANIRSNHEWSETYFENWKGDDTWARKMLLVFFTNMFLSITGSMN